MPGKGKTDLEKKVDMLVENGDEIDVVDIEKIDTEIEDEFEKVRLTKQLRKLIKQFREQDVGEIIADAESVDYKINKDEVYMLTDFVVPTDAPSVIRCLETVINSWFRLGMHLTYAEDLELSASNDLITKKAKALPDPGAKKDKGYTETDRSSVVDLETESEREYHRLTKRLRKRLALLVDCTKEYINVLKKMLDYYSGRPGIRNRNDDDYNNSRHDSDDE